MNIYVTTGVGEGKTPLAAFDAALINAGVANYNLICLSSVIPPNSIIRKEKYIAPTDEYGHLLYVVMARYDEQQRGKSAWAGLGWTQNKESGRGLFVEIRGSSSETVRNNIYATLEPMIASRSLPYGIIESEIVGIECHDSPVCALTVAVYQSVSWERLLNQ